MAHSTFQSGTPAGFSSNTRPKDRPESGRYASFKARAPKYHYVFPCGQSFQSDTPPARDDLVYCRGCGRYDNVRPWSVEARYREVTPASARDMYRANRQDDAIRRDRIAQEIWSYVTLADIARSQGVSTRTVLRVGKEIGAYETRTNDIGEEVLTNTITGEDIYDEITEEEAAA